MQGDVHVEGVGQEAFSLRAREQPKSSLHGLSSDGQDVSMKESKNGGREDWEDMTPHPEARSSGDGEGIHWWKPTESGREDVEEEI